MGIADKLLAARDCVRQKPWRHWRSAGLVLVLSMAVAPYIYAQFEFLQRSRAALFQWVISLEPRPLLPRHVRVVLIDDRDYWLGMPDGRRPINREYLARLVGALDAAGAQVIALDFDLRLPDPDGTEIPAAYKEESDHLVAAVLHAAERRKVVLPRTIWIDAAGQYRLDQDIFQPYGLCSALRNGRWVHEGTSGFPVSERAARNITCGYIALSSDRLVLPGQIRISGQGRLDSFALAVAKARDPDVVGTVGENVRYGSFIPPPRIDEFHVVHSAGELLAREENAESPFDGRPVIIGGNWCRFALGRCPGIDVHRTPVGDMPGALIHANFAEAILDSRGYPATPWWTPHLFEFLFGALTAVFLAAFANVPTKIAAIAGVFGLLVLMQLISLILLGIFFEAVIPVIGLGIHSALDRLLE